VGLVEFVGYLVEEVFADDGAFAAYEGLVDP
jgi:hypothetical protein